jgi:membrane protease subunit HflC
VDIDDIFSDFKDCDPSVNPEFNEILGDTVAAFTKKPKSGNEKVKAMRSQVVHGILKVSNERLGEEFGSIVEDLHFKYLNYSPKVHDVIVNKIKSDRKQEIATYNEVGDECVGYIQGITKREQGEIIGKADRLVREIDGRAIAEAIQIKSSAFQSNPDFYRFIKTLELYERSMKSRTSLILSMDSPILSLMKDASVMGAVPKKAVPKEKKALPKEKKALPKKEEKAPQ